MYFYEGTLVLEAPERPPFLWHRYTIAESRDEAEEEFKNFFSAQFDRYPHIRDYINSGRIKAVMIVRDFSSDGVIEYEP